MNQTLENKNEILTEICITFAEIYKYPNEEFYQEVITGNIDRELKTLLSHLNIKIEPSIKSVCPSFDELHKQYMDLFSGIKEPFAPPIESLYKQWTTDSTTQLSIAKQKGYLMGDSALHMKYLYDQFAIEVPEEFSNMPDHLALQLEFLAFLHQYSDVEKAKQFTKEHLNWLCDFLEELEKIENNSFYLYATMVLQSFIKNYYIEI